MPGLQGSSSCSLPTPMGNTAVIELHDGRTESRREFAEKMATFAKCSSGSEHQPDSAYLGDLVLGFMEEAEPPGADHTFSEDRRPQSPQQHYSGEYHILEGLAKVACPIERIVAEEAIRALQTALSADRFPENEESKCRKRHAVMNHLRSAGYDAAVCRSRGKCVGSFPSGDYEYIDVEMRSEGGNNGVRLVVDIDFRAQFEIARPTEEYRAMVGVLPHVFVGRAERLQQIVRILCVGAKRSLKSNGMHLPPWRKHRYMQSKWSGPYKRTTNPVAESASMVVSSEGCSANIYYCGEEIGVMAGWKPPKPSSSSSVERPPGRVYSALANALKERIPLTVF